MSLQDLSAVVTAQGGMDYDDAEITYAVIDEGDILQAGSFQNLQTLVEVSSILAGQNLHSSTNLHNLQTHNPPPKLVQTKTILPHRAMVGSVQPQPRIQYLATNVPDRIAPPSSYNAQVSEVTAKRGRAAEVRECHVCGEKAGKHSYYGGQVCPSCRAFFRRSVQSGYNVTYFCIKEGDCEVTLKTRKNCQYCRYKLCEVAGMKTTWVLTEQERKLKFEGRKKKKSGSPVDGSSENTTEVARVFISPEELLEVQQYVKISGYWDQSKVNDMNTNLIREFIRMVAFKHTLSPGGQKELRAVIRKRVEKFAERVQELTELSYQDKQEILENNLPCLLELQLCSTFNPDLQWTEQLSPLLGQEETDKLDNKLRSLNVTDLDELHLTYLQFFPGCQQHDTYRLLGLITDIGSWSQDEKEYILVSLVLLFCSDMLNLMGRKRVEEIQLKFATLLQKYLNNKHKLEPNIAVSRFAAGMLLVSRCRDVRLLNSTH